MKVYIAGPISVGDTALNIRRALEAAERVRELGHYPFVPHLFHFWHFAFPHPHDWWMQMDLEWLLICDAVLRLPGKSPGADREVKMAGHNGIRVFCSLEELQEATGRE